MQERDSGDDAPRRTTPRTARSRTERPRRAALNREAAGKKDVGSDSVFTAMLGAPTLPGNLYHILKRLCARAEVPYLGTHVARHTFASMLGANGVAVEVVSAHLGHAKPSFTLDRYCTVFQSECKHITLDFTRLEPLPGKQEEGGLTPPLSTPR